MNQNSYILAKSSFQVKNLSSLELELVDQRESDYRKVEALITPSSATGSSYSLQGSNDSTIILSASDLSAHLGAHVDMTQNWNTYEIDPSAHQFNDLSYLPHTFAHFSPTPKDLIYDREPGIHTALSHLAFSQDPYQGALPMSGYPVPSPFMGYNQFQADIPTLKHFAEVPQIISTTPLTHPETRTPSPKRAKKPRASLKEINTTSTSNADTERTPITPSPTSGASRRKTVSETCICAGACRKPISVMYMRGTVESLEQTYVIQIVCDQCSEGPSKSPFLNNQIKVEDDDGVEYVPTTRKRSRDRSSMIECEVCRHYIGSGGIKPLHPESYTPNEIELSVEYTCLSCASKYLFCSECGGGGKTRTGKWRPKELFEPGRKTCSLPHIRIGNATLNYEVLDPLTQLDGYIMKELQDVFFDCSVSLYAIPSTMESSRYGSFESVKAEITSLWNQSVMDYLMSPTEPGVNRYLIVQWMDKPHRNKGKAKSPLKDNSNLWLKKLSLDSLDNLDLPRFDRAEDVSDRCYVSFAIAEWNQSTKSIFMVQIVPRSIFLRPMETYGELFKLTAEHVTAHARHLNVTPPKYMWCWTRGDNPRARAIPDRLGFREKDDFLDINKHLTARTFAKPSFAPLQDDDVMIHVVDIKHFMEKQK